MERVEEFFTREDGAGGPGRAAKVIDLRVGDWDLGGLRASRGYGSFCGKLFLGASQKTQRLCAEGTGERVAKATYLHELRCELSFAG